MGEGSKKPGIPAAETDSQRCMKRQGPGDRSGERGRSEGATPPFVQITHQSFSFAGSLHKSRLCLEAARAATSQREPSVTNTIFPRTRVTASCSFAWPVWSWLLTLVPTQHFLGEGLNHWPVGLFQALRVSCSTRRVGEWAKVASNFPSNPDPDHLTLPSPSRLCADTRGWLPEV